MKNRLFVYLCTASAKTKNSRMSQRETSSLTWTYGARSDTLASSPHVCLLKCSCTESIEKDLSSSAKWNVFIAWNRMSSISMNAMYFLELGSNTATEWILFSTINLNALTIGSDLLTLTIDFSYKHMPGNALLSKVFFSHCLPDRSWFMGSMV